MKRGSPTRDSLAVAASTARADAPAHKIHRLAQLSTLDRTIDVARDALLNRQTEEGYWLFELEADCTIPAEYIMMMHYLDEIDSPRREVAVYLRTHADHGGWPLSMTASST